MVMKRLASISSLLLILSTGVLFSQESDPIWHSVIITEIMVSPNIISPGSGQWIELYNPSDKEINLQGMTITTDSGYLHIISQAKPLYIPGKGYMVLGCSANLEINGGVKVSYEYGGEISFDQVKDGVRLLFGGKIVDQVTYGQEKIAPVQGRSMQVEPKSLDGETHWCYGRILYGTYGNYGTPGTTNTDCDDDNDGFAEDQGDCNDDNPSVNPNAFEVCNGIDDDCDGVIDDNVFLLPEEITCLSEGVCAGAVSVCAGIEGWICQYPKDLYEVKETRCDGLDNDCDGMIDEVPDGLTCLEKGVCGDTKVTCIPDVGFICPYPKEYEEEETLCDGLDNDCDGLTDEGMGLGNPCSVGVGACLRTGIIQCSKDGKGTICSATPGLPTFEICGDGIDNDCNGMTDEGYPVGEVCSVGEGACKSLGKYKCAQGGMGVYCEALPSSPEDEICEDGIDNDCDGITDEEDCIKKKKTSKNGCMIFEYGNHPLGLFLIYAIGLSIFLIKRLKLGWQGKM